MARAASRRSELPTQDWVTQQWLHFLEVLPDDLGAQDMSRLDATFDFTHSGNSEILCAWLELAIGKSYSEADVRLEQFLMNVGRRKFLKPLYKALARTGRGWPGRA